MSTWLFALALLLLTLLACDIDDDRDPDITGLPGGGCAA